MSSRELLTNVQCYRAAFSCTSSRPPTSMENHAFKATADGLEVNAFVHIPSHHLSDVYMGIILAHGAGGNMDSPAIKSLATGLEEKGNFIVVRFTATSLNFDHRVKQYAAVASFCSTPRFKEDHLPTECSINKWLYAGRSMGARAAAALAPKLGSTLACVGVVAFSYPLHKEKDLSMLRDELLIDLDEASVPLLLVSGTRDSMCKPDILAQVRSRMNTGLHRLVKVVGATHSGNVLGGKVVNEKLETVISSLVSSWVEALTSREGLWRNQEPTVTVINKDLVEEWEPTEVFPHENKTLAKMQKGEGSNMVSLDLEMKVVEVRRPSLKRKAKKSSSPKGEPIKERSARKNRGVRKVENKA